jgi:hypothetical protein
MLHYSIDRYEGGLTELSKQLLDKILFATNSEILSQLDDSESDVMQSLQLLKTRYEMTVLITVMSFV